MFHSAFDNIGFNPTQNQSEYGTPRHSPIGLIYQSIPPMASIDYFPTDPYRGRIDYTGSQGYTSDMPESLFAQTHLYRGIAPLGLQPLIDRPYPYE